MQITNVSVEQGRRFVPVKGWAGVVKTLNYYAGANTPGAQASQFETAKGIEKGTNSLAAGIFLLGSTMAGNRNNLVDKLLLEAGQSLEKRAEFEKSYDYDGGDVFHKTSVTIKKLGDDDMYAIGLYASYVGDKPEEGLAQRLGVPRTLLSCCIEVETKAAGKDRFEFDFEPVLHKLDAVLDIKKISGKQVAKAMLQKDDFGDGGGVFQLAEKDGLRVRIQPGRVERRMQYDRTSGKENDTWSVKGSVLSGKLAPDYRSEDKSVKATPTLKIVVSSAELFDAGFRKEPKSLWRPEQQQQAIDLANRIAAALK